MPIYKPTLMFIEAKRIKKSKVIRLNIGEKVRAKKGEYHVTFPNGKEGILAKEFFLAFYEPANTTVHCSICLDFNSVFVHPTLWLNKDSQDDENFANLPIHGVLNQIVEYLDNRLTVAVYSTRSAQVGGIKAMQQWIDKHLVNETYTPLSVRRLSIWKQGHASSGFSNLFQKR